MNEKKRDTTKARSAHATIWAMALTIALQALVPGDAAGQSTQPEATTTVPVRHRVLIITTDSTDPFMARVHAEVKALPGVSVILHGSTGSLDSDARAEQAEVAIRKLLSGQGVEVWMADATSGRSLIRQIVVDENPRGPDAGLVALQTAELLRTGLLLGRSVVTTASTGAVSLSPSVPPETVVAAPSRSPTGEDIVLAGAGPLWSTGGVGAALQSWLSYQHLWSGRLGLSLDASAPLHLGSISRAEGSARVGAISAGAGLLARSGSEQGRLTGTATVGAALVAVVVKGDPKPSYPGDSTTTYAGMAYLRLAATWKPVPWLGLGGAGFVGTSTRRIRIQFAGHPVADWGPVLLGAALHGEIAW